MIRRTPAWLAALAALTMLITVVGSALAQDEPEAEPDSSAVENILREQEEALSGQHFTYEPGGRRDPFRSLLEAIRMTKTGKRPPGIQGMLVSEIDLAGIVEDARTGDVGLLIGSDNKGYFLHVGDAVYDGTVIAIDPRLGTVTFRQQIDDPRMIKPYRDVVKRLVPLDDEESADE